MAKSQKERIMNKKLIKKIDKEHEQLPKTHKYFYDVDQTGEEFIVITTGENIKIPVTKYGVIDYSNWIKKDIADVIIDLVRKNKEQVIFLDKEKFKKEIAISFKQRNRSKKHMLKIQWDNITMTSVDEELSKCVENLLQRLFDSNDKYLNSCDITPIAFAPLKPNMISRVKELLNEQ